MHIEKKRPKQQDLFFRTFYFNIRNYKTNFDINISTLTNIMEICSLGYYDRTINLKKSTREKLGKILNILEKVHNHLKEARNGIIEILDLYEGLGNINVHEADVETIFQHKNPMNDSEWK